MINLLQAQHSQLAEEPKVINKRKDKEKPIVGIFFKQRTLSKQNLNE